MDESQRRTPSYRGPEEGSKRLTDAGVLLTEAVEKLVLPVNGQGNPSPKQSGEWVELKQRSLTPQLRVAKRKMGSRLRGVRACTNNMGHTRRVGCSSVAKENPADGAAGNSSLHPV